MIHIFILFVFIKLSFSTVTLSQNVGIGTSAPLSKLHIVDNSAINTKVRIETDNTPNLANIAINNTARAGGISMGIVNNFNTYGDPGENFIYSSVNAEGLNIINQNLSGNGHIAFYTSGNHLTTPLLYLSDNDRVGIGNAIPSEKLDVTGNARISALGGAGNAIVTTNNDGVLGRTAMTGNGSDVLVGTGAFVPISSLNDDDWTVVGANMYSTPSGNVGIGTTVPSTKLDVVGVIELSNEAPADPGSDIVRLGDGGTNLHIQTNYGYTRVGPQNANWSHFATDRARYYFDKGVTVNQGLVGSYDENLQLQTSGTTRMTVLNSNGNVGLAFLLQDIV